MSGHSKWSTIKHKKAKTDAQKGKAFSKVGREVMMAAKIGGGDIDMNPRLRLAIQKAKEVNMPNDNIKRAIQKGAGGGDDTQLEEVTFEAYGPHGVAILIQVLTDNKNRTIPNLRFILNKAGGSLATKGAVAYLFNNKGLLLFKPGTPEDQVMDIAVEAGADDIETYNDGAIEVRTSPDMLETVKQAFDEMSISYETARLMMIPSTWVTLEADTADTLQTLIDAIEDDDDVQDVFSNFDIQDV